MTVCWGSSVRNHWHRTPLLLQHPSLPFKDNIEVLCCLPLHHNKTVGLEVDNTHNMQIAPQQSPMVLECPHKPIYVHEILTQFLVDGIYPLIPEQLQ